MEAALKVDVAAFKAAIDATTKDVEQMHLEWSSIVEGALKQSIALVGEELETFKGDVVDKHYDTSLTLAEVQKSVVCVQENTNVLRKMLEDWSLRSAKDSKDDCASSTLSGGSSLGALTTASDKINTVETLLRDCEKYCSELDLHCSGVVDRMQEIQLRLTYKTGTQNRFSLKCGRMQLLLLLRLRLLALPMLRASVILPSPLTISHGFAALVKCSEAMAVQFRQGHDSVCTDFCRSCPSHI